MKRSGIITLLTDFGSRDPFAGVMRGVIWSRFPAARIADLTHEIEPQNLRSGAFWLERAFRWFPKGTVHVAVVDPGVGTSRAILGAKVDGHLLLAPDNGILGPVLENSMPGDIRVVRLALETLGSFGIEGWSATFHGRDIFAPLAAELAAGRASLRSLGPRIEVHEAVASVLPKPWDQREVAEGLVAVVDRFGNLITNIPGRMVARFDRPRIRLRDLELPLSRTYGQHAAGEYAALVSSFDRLEIARVNGSAAQSLAIGAGEPVRVFGRPH